MPNSIAQNTAKSAQDIAKQIAKQIAQEPSEILRDVKEQTGIEIPQQNEFRKNETVNTDNQNLKQAEESDKLKSARMMQALNRELEDIRKQDLFSDLQKRISAGEKIPLEEYITLSLEQKQVLKAQMEAYKIQMQKMENQNYSEVPTIQSKPSRRFGAGQKREAEKQQTRVEKPVPPSG